MWKIGLSLFSVDKLRKDPNMYMYKTKNLNSYKKWNIKKYTLDMPYHGEENMCIYVCVCISLHYLLCITVEQPTNKKLSFSIPI